MPDRTNVGNVPTIILDSARPGLMGITVHDPNRGNWATTWLTREAARQFGIDVLATSEKSFMRYGVGECPRCGAERSDPNDDMGWGPTCIRQHEEDVRRDEAEDDPSVQHEGVYE